MALKIKLFRMGKTKQPSYRVVIMEARTPRQSQYIEQVGFYNPLSEPAEVRFVEDRVKHWLSVGAKPTDTVSTLIKKYTSIELK